MYFGSLEFHRFFRPFVLYLCTLPKYKTNITYGSLFPNKISFYTLVCSLSVFFFFFFSWILALIIGVLDFYFPATFIFFESSIAPTNLLFFAHAESVVKDNQNNITVVEKKNNKNAFVTDKNNWTALKPFKELKRVEVAFFRNPDFKIFTYVERPFGHTNLVVRPKGSVGTVNSKFTPAVPPLKELPSFNVESVTPKFYKVVKKAFPTVDFKALGTFKEASEPKVMVSDISKLKVTPEFLRSVGMLKGPAANTSEVLQAWDVVYSQSKFTKVINYDAIFRALNVIEKHNPNALGKALDILLDNSRNLSKTSNNKIFLLEESTNYATTNLELGYKEWKKELYGQVTISDVEKTAFKAGEIPYKINKEFKIGHLFPRLAAFTKERPPVDWAEEIKQSKEWLDNNCKLSKKSCKIIDLELIAKKNKFLYESALARVKVGECTHFEEIKSSETVQKVDLVTINVKEFEERELNNILDEAWKELEEIRLDKILDEGWKELEEIRLNNILDESLRELEQKHGETFITKGTRVVENIMEKIEEKNK